jgi:hypothetical protein
MKLDLIKSIWEKSEYTKPNVLILLSNGRYFAVVEDNTNIVIVVSKSEVVYAVAKNRIKLSEINGEILYVLDDYTNLKIISCTRETIEKRYPDQFFVINNIIKHI